MTDYTIIVTCIYMSVVLFGVFKLSDRLQCFAEVFSMLLKERQCQLAKHLVRVLRHCVCSLCIIVV